MERLLYVEGAPHCFKGALELYQEGVAYGLDLPASVPGKKGPDKRSLFLQELHCEGLVSLSQGCVTDGVGEHDCGESALPL